MRIPKQLKHLLLAISLTLAGCGGGGGGGGTQAVTYSGVTTPATVTSSNARVLSVDAYEGGRVGSSMGVIGVASESPAQSAVRGRLLILGTTLTSSVRQVMTAPATGVPALAGATEEDTIYGYSGSFHYAISVDQASGAFNGTLSFNSYVGSEGGPVLSGSMGFSGVYNEVSGTFSSLNMTLYSLAVTEAGQTATVYGTLSLTIDGSSESIAMSLVLKDGTGRTYWVKDYTFVSTGGTVTLTGTYYDPVHGYVTVSTLTPLTVATPDAWPTAGQLLFTGANGSKARLTFLSTGYTVEVDVNGSNSFTPVP